VDCGKEYIFIPVIFDGREIMADRERLCDTCIKNREDKETTTRAREQAEDHKQWQDKRWKDICPIKYRKTIPERLPQDKLKQVMAWEYNPRGLILYGRTGTFKTRASWLLLQKLHYQGIKIAAFDSTDFVNKCADKFCDGTGGAWIESLIRMPMFFIDDLGNEPSGERGAGEIWHIIKRRDEEELPVIITTNSVGKELAGKLRGPEDRGSAMVRRLREFCDTIAF